VQYACGNTGTRQRQRSKVLVSRAIAPETRIGLQCCPDRPDGEIGDPAAPRTGGKIFLRASPVHSPGRTRSSTEVSSPDAQSLPAPASRGAPFVRGQPHLEKALPQERFEALFQREALPTIC
jgi:hypothetical protein